MNPSLFLKNKIQREIKYKGNMYLFSHCGKDDYGQETNDTANISISGIFHQSSGFKTLLIADSTKVETKPKPMIICLTEDASKLSKEDTVIINNNKYKIVGFDDIQNYGVVNEISLEVIDV